MSAAVPIALKILQGTNRKDREWADLDVKPIDEVPPPVDWLPNSHAVKEWNRLAPILIRNKLLNDANIGAFAQLCALFGKMVQTWSAGDTPPGNVLGKYRQLMNDFGLTPAAAGKLGQTGGSGRNSFANNGRK